jgi:peptidoglycan endopeptidase LytF
MSRRDTIIVAVLINAGLLIVLFASALKSNSNIPYAAQSVPIVQEVPEPSFKKEPAFVAGDEVDKALSQFSSNPVVSDNVTPQAVVSQPSSPASSFAEDLNALAPVPLVPPSVPKSLASTSNQMASDWIEVKVKKGDVLEKIARQHHTTVAEIMKVNKLTGSNLQIGQTLKIPNKTLKKEGVSQIAQAPAPSSESVAQDASTAYYIVKKGDSPWTIAVKNHLKVEELLRLNNLNEEQARRLKPGDKLRIK